MSSSAEIGLNAYIKSIKICQQSKMLLSPCTSLRYFPIHSAIAPRERLLSACSPGPRHPLPHAPYWVFRPNCQLRYGVLPYLVPPHSEMFFSIDNAPFSSKNKNKLCEISKYVESWNEQIAFGELKVEQERGVVYLQRELEVTEEAALEEDLVTLVNEMLTVFFSHVPCLYTLATATTSVDENSPSLQPVQIPLLQHFTYPRTQSNTDIARQN